jgi:hypothetical protein
MKTATMVLLARLNVVGMAAWTLQAIGPAKRALGLRAIGLIGEKRLVVEGHSGSKKRVTGSCQQT